MAVKCEKCGHEHEGWVPKERLSETAQARAESEARAKAAEAAVAKAQADAAAALKASEGTDALRKTLAEWEAKGAGWDTERAIMAAGILDGEGIGVASMMWGKLAADKRPTGGISEWLAGRDTLPRAVQAYLPSAAPAQSGEPPAPRVGTGGGAGHTDAPAPWSADQIAAIAGDHVKYAANRAQIRAALGAAPPPALANAKARG